MSWSDLGWVLLAFENLVLGAWLYIYLHQKCQQCKKEKRIDRIFQKLCRKCSEKEKKDREIKRF